MALPELLAGQRRPKIGVALTNQAQGTMSEILRQLMVARVTTALRNQPGWASGAIPGDQPFNLPSTDPKSLRGSPRHQTLLDHGFHDLQTIQFPHAHGDQSRLAHDALRQFEPPPACAETLELRHF
ncbi:hypothetical protein WT63_13835 [Burkholderia anthina]|nr:hypothetical protein WT63_13835 [Burkholderia anthina]